MRRSTSEIRTVIHAAVSLPLARTPEERAERVFHALAEAGFEIVPKPFGKDPADILRQVEADKRRADELGLTVPRGDDIARIASTVPLTQEAVSAAVERLDREDEFLAAIHGPDGIEHDQLSDLGWLRLLLRSAQNPGAFQALQGDSDDPDAVFIMLQCVEDMYRRLAALTGQRTDIYDSENLSNRGEAA